MLSNVGNLNDLISHAKRNGGVFTRREAMALGCPPRTLTRRVNDGVFVRLVPGVYALPGLATRADVLLRAAGAHFGAIVSHRSAARMHGLKPVGKSPLEVTVTHRGTNRFPGVLVHQTTDLIPDHVTVIGGTQVTNPERTVIDLAQVVSLERLARILDNALASSLVDVSSLANMCAALSRKGKTGMSKLKPLVAQRTGKPVAETSELEAHMSTLIERAGLPKPVKEFKAPWLRPIAGRVDFAFIEQKVLVECDGRRWHTKFDAFEVDRRRDNAAQLAGWIVLRFTWRMVVDNPMEVVAEVREALNTRV